VTRQDASQSSTPARWAVTHVTAHGANDFEEALANALNKLPGAAQHVSVSHAMVERVGGTFYSAAISYWLPAVRFV
jgi:hypothetical protein